MRWAFVAHDDTTATGCVAFAFALHQHMHTAVEGDNLTFLPRDHFRQIVDSAGKMGDFFFKFVSHGGHPFFAGLAWWYECG